jgi:hypothetical protein
MNRYVPKVDGKDIKERILSLIDERIALSENYDIYVEVGQLNVFEERSRKKMLEINKLLDMLLAHYPE